MKHTGPRARAARYAYRQPNYEGVNGTEIMDALRDAWLAGYRAAARARRKIDTPTPPRDSLPTLSDDDRHALQESYLYPPTGDE
jgi:hypothetical protein